MLSKERTEKLDPRVKRTRGLLEQAFMDVLTEKGFQAVTVQDIAERAGVNRATFYAHFEDKYALLNHTIRRKFRQEIEKHMLNASQFSMDNLRLLFISLCEFVDNANAHCKPSESQFESLVESQVKEQLRELLQDWIEQVGSKMDAHTAATATSWAIYGLALHWSHQKKRPAPEHFAEQVLPLISANLRMMEPAKNP